ncbi:Teichoic acid glycerol-phosphate primase [Lentibacillus sp. JNUCC-1]|uniref:CDP-glycerol glycerophosphotransferase family protein n=1 Tax=Lentibacillus sp. JNUCC-1 TaxID=2654513 RepID=UPI0012E7899B|nr:CDP-glycerol glycerophosphotransferase family protein [Lentibacillus sp. JNUCC-1]MUV37302.1 Teichoic acid glycerol-phosphate primase [Lentibacillus sp. JNUCC-1]
MVREAAITAYLFFFRIVFSMLKLFPQQNKTVCVASFGDNIYYTASAIRDVSDERVVILKDSQCRYAFDASVADIVPFDIKHPFAYFLSIYHLATAKTVIVDNYFGFLAVTNFKPGTVCVQLWHAVGALKRFALMDPSISNRSKRAKQRFQNVYSRFDYVTAGSERMAQIFQKSFSLGDDAIIRTGVPRTDVFFDSNEQKNIIKVLRKMYPVIETKKVILYAPTFRDDELDNYKIQLNIKQMYEKLGDAYVLFVKNHPAVTYHLSQELDSFVYDVSDYYDANHILLITDILITDYSSIPCEFALLERPMIFYAYDLQEYKNTRGLLYQYQIDMPGPIAYTTEDIIRIVQESKFDKNEIKRFAEAWNRYSNGQSSFNVARFLNQTDLDQQMVK